MSANKRVFVLFAEESYAAPSIVGIYASEGSANEKKRALELAQEAQPDEIEFDSDDDWMQAFDGWKESNKEIFDWLYWDSFRVAEFEVEGK
jgi:hypothetical protein